MDIYKSKNSQYYYEGESLVRVKGSKKTYLGENVVYAPKHSIESLLKKHSIPIRKVKTVETKKGEDFMNELKKNEMDRSKTGGRFFALRGELEENYSIFCSGEIVDIKIKEGAKIELEEELELSDKNDEFKIED